MATERIYGSGKDRKVYMKINAYFECSADEAHQINALMDKTKALKGNRWTISDDPITKDY